MTEHCIVCGGTDLAALVEIPDVAVHCNVICGTRAEALAVPRARIDLAVCRGCGHVFNASFDAAHMGYSEGYESSLDGSLVFTNYADALAERLIADHNLHGKDVVEIGCGNARFLELICGKGANRGVGFDPAAEPRRCGANGEDVRVFGDCYDEPYGSYKGDLVICRHVLEHISDPGAFVELLRSAMKGTSANLFIEVPNGMYTLETGLVWDLIYEHCSYFCKSSLARLLRDHGLSVRRLATDFGGQFLWSDAAPVQAGEPGVVPRDRPESIAYIHAFPAHFHRMIESWHHHIAAAASNGQMIVAWGAGSKGVTFLNLVDRELGAVRHIVDINPKKAGKFVAGTGQEIVPPAALKEIRPDLVLLMNPIYRQEVQVQLARLGLSPVVKAVLSV